MDQNLSQRLLDRIDRYLYDPRLDAESLLRKRWTWIWLVVTLAGVIFSIILFMVVLEFWPLWWSAVPLLLGYLVAFLSYRKTLRFDLVINSVFTIFIIDFFAIMIVAGGFPTSLGMTVAGLNCAMASVLTGNRKWMFGMFSLYVLTIVLLGILQPYLTTPDFITPRANTIANVAEFVWITAATWMLMMFFVRDQRRFQRAEAERMRKINEARTHLYTNVSHEFRTPLTLIQGMAEQLEKDPGKWLARGPVKIREQSQVLLRLVNQMLDIARIEAGGMEPEAIHGDLVRFTRHVTGSFRGLAEYKTLDLEFIDPGMPVMTDYDPDKLMQVLSNLVANAIKFTPAGGSVTVKVTRVCEASGDKAVISVTDTGRGIPEGLLERVFERFYQVPDPEVQTPGTGLGLAVTRELVRLMDGEVTVESTPGSGTIFSVTLPLLEEAPPAEDHGIDRIHPGTLQAIPLEQSERAEIIAEQHDDEGRPVLLIVEDNPDVQEYLVTILKGHYRIDLAGNGREGLEKAVEAIPDIILTDVMMPVMDGFELLKRMREDHRTDHIPVVVLTARGDMDSQLTGLEIGADHYLVKPFSEQELVLKLRNLLDARNRMQQMLGKPGEHEAALSEDYPQEGHFLARFRAKLDEQLDNEDLSIQDLCVALNMSRSQLYRKFTAITNRPIGRYIRSFRLMRAREMMESAGRNVSEAAMDTGFKSLSHFSTAFREEYGFPPSELVRGQP